MVTGISLLEGHKEGVNRNLRYFRPSDWRCLLEALTKCCESSAWGALGDQTKLSSSTILFTVPIPSNDLTLSIFSVKPHIMILLVLYSTENGAISFYALAGV